MTDEHHDNDKPRRGKWAPGQSGNPLGRKPGSGETARLRKQITEHIPEIITKLIERANAGDVKAARILLDRVLAPLKAEAGAITLPELAAASGLVAQGEALVLAIADGRLAPDIGAALLAALNQQARLVEIEDLERRIAALEQDGHDLI